MTLRILALDKFWDGSTPTLLKDFPMTVAQSAHRSKVVQAVGVFLILVGILETLFIYSFVPKLFPPAEGEVVPFMVSFIPALISCAIGVGILLQKRWALFAWLALTGLALASLLADLVVSIETPFGRSQVMLALMGPAFLTALVMGIPAYLLWKRRTLFSGRTRAASSDYG